MTSSSQFIIIDGQPYTTVKDAMLLTDWARGTLHTYAETGWIDRRKIGATVLYAVADLRKGRPPRQRKPSAAVSNLHRRSILWAEVAQWEAEGLLKRPLTPTPPTSPSVPRKTHDGSWQGHRPGVIAPDGTSTMTLSTHGADGEAMAHGGIPEGCQRSNAIVPNAVKLEPSDDQSLTELFKV